MSNAEEICKEKLFKAYQQEMADLEITDEATYNPPVWVIEAMEEYANQALQELKAKMEKCRYSNEDEDVRLGYNIAIDDITHRIELLIDQCHE